MAPNPAMSFTPPLPSWQITILSQLYFLKKDKTHAVYHFDISAFNFIASYSTLTQQKNLWLVYHFELMQLDCSEAHTPLCFHKTGNSLESDLYDVNMAYWTCFYFIPLWEDCHLFVVVYFILALMIVLSSLKCDRQSEAHTETCFLAVLICLFLSCHDCFFS